MKMVGAMTYPPSPESARQKCGDFFRRENSLKQFVFDVARATSANFSHPADHRAAAIHIGIADVGHAGHERRESALLLRLRPVNESAPWCAMESAEEGDHVLPLAVIARQLQSALDASAPEFP